MPKKKPTSPIAPADPSGLPPLNWDGSSWTARIHLPSWAGTPDCSGPYASATGETSDGYVALSIEVESLDGGGTAAAQGTGPSPSTGQWAAYEYILAHDEELRELTCTTMVRYVGEANERIRKYHGPRFEEFLALGMKLQLTPPTDVKRELGLSSVLISNEAYDGIALFGFEMGCSWDEEHGAGILFYKNVVVDYGQADSSFSGLSMTDAEFRDFIATKMSPVVPEK